MTIKKKIWRFINILIILALIISVWNFIKNSRYAIPLEGDFFSFLNGEIDEVKFPTSYDPSVYRIYREESGIRVKKYSESGFIKKVMKCEDMVQELEVEQLEMTVLKKCGPEKENIKIEGYY